MKEIDQLYGEVAKRTPVELANEEEIVFENCTFINCDINLVSACVEFINCKFYGQIKIYNQDIGDMDIVNIEGCNPDPATCESLSVSSTSVRLVDSTVDVGELSLDGAEIEIGNSTIRSNISIACLRDLTITSSNVQNIDSKKFSSVSTTIRNSYINGIAINMSQPQSNFQP